MLSVLVGLGCILKALGDEADPLWGTIGLALIFFGVLRMLFFRDLWERLLPWALG
ncbi:MAG: hypothetical protein K8I02_04865 [Candidatus Methylomirabilis sp.]|nr:hypothetical protein [Deltaproteobacteria bacterium]